MIHDPARPPHNPSSNRGEVPHTQQHSTTRVPDARFTMAMSIVRSMVCSSKTARFTTSGKKAEARKVGVGQNTLRPRNGVATKCRRRRNKCDKHLPSERAAVRACSTNPARIRDEQGRLEKGVGHAGVTPGGHHRAVAGKLES